MALNPIAYTENVVRSFLRYQLTAYPFTDPNLYAVSPDARVPLAGRDAKTSVCSGPDVSLSRSLPARLRFHYEAPAKKDPAVNLRSPNQR